MASWWHQLLHCLSAVLLEEFSLDFTANHVLSYYPLPCQSHQVSLSAFSDATNLGFPLLTHSGNMATALASSHGPGRAPRGCFDCQEASKPLRCLMGLIFAQKAWLWEKNRRKNNCNNKSLKSIYSL